MINHRFQMSREDSQTYINSEILKKIPTTKERFMLLMALGYNNHLYITVGGESVFIDIGFNDEDLALIYAVAIKTKEKIENINSTYELLEIANSYANGGLHFLEYLENNMAEDQFKYLEKEFFNHISNLE
ncbi:MAG: hypothetical protein HUK28_03540 [Methanobrevibacter sp.]|nr:hypothetical protein [Methanobrevibacter sp.]